MPPGNVDEKTCEARREALNERFKTLFAQNREIKEKLDRIDRKIGMINALKNFFALLGGALASWFGRDAIGG